MLAELIPLLTSILAAAPQLVEEVKQIWALVTATNAPSADQQAQIDAALDAAHQALQQS